MGQGSEDGIGKVALRIALSTHGVQTAKKINITKNNVILKAMWRALSNKAGKVS